MPRLDHNERLIIGLTLALKLGVLLLGLGAWQLVHGSGTPPFPGLELWDRWDAPHYTDLIVYGYRGDRSGQPGRSLRLPAGLPGRPGAVHRLLPALSRGSASIVNALIHQPVWSAFIVAGIASLFVGPLMYRLVRHDETPDVALRSAWFLLIFPTAYFLHIGYTEALFMALVLGSFLAARTERWWLAGLIGGLAALTRINGLVLLLALPVEAATQWFTRAAGGAALAVGVAGDRAGRRSASPSTWASTRRSTATPFQFLIVQQRPLVQVAGRALGRHQRARSAGSGATSPTTS